MDSLQDLLARGARVLVLSQLRTIEHGTLTIQDQDGSTTVVEGPQGKNTSISVTLTIKSPKAWVRIVHSYDIGFAEAFMLGELACSNLTDFFRLLLLSSGSYDAGSAAEYLYTLANLATAPLYRLSNTSSQALTNARNHYSLGNEVFAAFLDSTMTYSAPLWLPTSHPDASSDTLAAAQTRKLQYTISAARLQSSDHVLEIGTGWGSFAIEAVRQTGCRVTTVTASAAQAVLAKQNVEAAGFADHITVLVCDYRQIPLRDSDECDSHGRQQAPQQQRRYDKIVSIEMIEHVGHAFLEVYFACVDRYLDPTHGIGVFQCITLPEARYAGYNRRQDFIQRYIFPGAHIPTVSHLVSSINAGSKGRLVVEDIKSVSGNYVRALREWRENFVANWEREIKPALSKGQPNLTKTDLEVFRRKWEYYFSYCEAGFATKRLGDVSITVGREGAVALIDDIPF